MHYWDPQADPILLKDSSGFGKDLAGFIHSSSNEVRDWPYKKAEIYTNSKVIEVRKVQEIDLK